MYYSSKNDTIFQIGKWERGTGLYVLKNATTQGSNESGKTPIWDDTGSSLETIFQNDSKDKVTLIVVTKEERPYVMLRENETGNNAYDGFCIDLLKVIFYMRKWHVNCFYICNI